MTILPGRHMSQVEIMFSVLWNESGFTVCINPPCSDHRDTSTFFAFAFAFALQFCCAVLCKKDVYKRNSCYSQHSFGQSARHLVKEAQFLKSIQAYNAIVLLQILDTELPLLYTTFNHVSAWIKLSGPVSDGSGQFARSAVVIIPFSGFFFRGQKCIGS